MRIRPPAFLPSMLLLSFAACEPPLRDPAIPSSGILEPTVEPLQPAAVEVRDPKIFEVFQEVAQIEVLATGFTWAEGPVWVAEGGYLLFSDVPEDTVFRWDEREGLRPWLRPSGHTTVAPRGREPGANGLALDAAGRLVLCQHGDRRLARLEAVDEGPWIDGPAAPFITLADRFAGRRFNSPNDLVIHPSGDIYFTDPPYGLPDEEARELTFNGVFRLDGAGRVHRLTDRLSRPNGIALSPDAATLYVANSDPQKALWMKWSLDAAGDLAAGTVLYDATSWVSDERPGLPDGMAVDRRGRIFATGPGGIWVFATDGRHLGTLRLPDPTANCALDATGAYLYMTSDHRLLRVALRSPSQEPPPA